MAACVGCGESVAAEAHFCSVCGRAVTVASVPPPPVYAARTSHLNGLTRPREQRMIAGVCAGFAQRFGWDLTIVRLVLAVSLIFGAGLPLLAYVIAWVVMPNGQHTLPGQVSRNGPGSMRV